MADETDPRLQLLLQETGGNNNTWGENLNDNFEKLSDAVAGVGEYVVTGSTLTMTDGEQRFAVLKFTGTLTSDQVVVVNDEEQWWIIDNSTSGEYALEFKTDSGNGSGNVSVDQGTMKLIYSDGTDVVDTGIVTAPDTEYNDGNVIYNVNGTGSFYSLITAPSGQTAEWAVGTDSERRWSFGKDATAESGSDVGSDLAIVAYDDDGTAIATYVTIARADGAITLNGALTVNGVTNFANDANFTATLSTDPFLTFDSTDYLTYDRSEDAFLFAIASTEVVDINASGLEIGGTGPRVTAFSTAAEWLNNTADKALVGDEVWDSAEEVTITFATTVIPDLSTGINFVITATDNLVIDYPINIKPGQKGCIRVINSGAVRSTSFSDNAGVWVFADGEVPETGLAANASDLIYYDCISDSIVFVNVVGGVN